MNCPKITSAATLAVGLAAAVHLYRVNNGTDDRSPQALNRQRIMSSGALFGVLALMTAVCLDREEQPVAYYGGLAVTLSLLAGSAWEYMSDSGPGAISTVWDLRANQGGYLHKAGRVGGYAAMAAGLLAVLYHGLGMAVEQVNELRGGGDAFAEYETLMSTEF